MMKLILIIPAVLTVAACSKPQETLEYAQNKCAFIGYSLETERVPTLQCVERQYNRKEDQNNALVNTVVNATIIASTGIALQGALAQKQDNLVVEHKSVQ